MTEKQIAIHKKVYERYPKTAKEFSCWQEKLRLQNLREQYRKRLESEAGYIEAKDTKSDGAF